jgi:hypothetical protein
MSRPYTRRPAPQPPPTRVECCIDPRCESGLRNNYFEGKRLTPDSFRVEQRYLVERRRLLNRAIHGWGVVYGYGIKAAASNEHRHETVSGRLTIGPGLALDVCGRELVQTEMIEQAVDQVIMLDDKGRRVDPPPTPKPVPGRGDRRYPSDDPRTECWLLSVHYAEQDVAPLTIHDPCSCKRCEWDHVCETVRYSLRRIDCGDCCKPVPCELDSDAGPVGAATSTANLPRTQRTHFHLGGLDLYPKHLSSRA